jgi:hypothetical protein
MSAALALDRSDLDDDGGVLLVRDAKFGNAAGPAAPQHDRRAPV